MSPLLYLSLALALAVPATYVVTKGRALQEAQASHEAGREAGRGEAAAANAAAVEATQKAQREAEERTPLVKGKQDLIALCKKSASCRERSTLK